MQARENTAHSRAWRAMLHGLYPGDCGLKSETGGIMSNLRALSADTIRQYHHSFYRPDNLCVIITGQVAHDAVFAKLAAVEERIAAHGPLTAMQRPWSTPVPPLSDSVLSQIQFPSDDESSGVVIVAWRSFGYADFTQRLALQALMKYLSDTAVSPLRRALVDTDDAICTAIHTSEIESSASVQLLMFEDVPTEKLGDLKKRLFDVLRTTTIDMARMTDVVTRLRIRHLNALETQANRTVAGAVIGHFLYGSSADQLGDAMNQTVAWDALLTNDAAVWQQMLTVLTGAPYVCVEAAPSAALGAQLSAEEEARVEERKTRLGDAGLQRHQQTVDDATLSNNKAIPEEMLSAVPVPSAARIPFVQVRTVRFTEAGPEVATDDAKPVLDHLMAGGQTLPTYFMQFDDVRSEFVRVRALCDTAKLNSRQRQFLPLLASMLFEAPIARDDGVTLSHEDVVASLNRDTVAFSCALGTSGSSFEAGPFAQYLNLTLKFDKSKYDLAARWIHDLLWSTQFTAERLRISANKLLNSIPASKRDGFAVTGALMKTMLYGSDSNHVAINMVKQSEFLTALLASLDTNATDVLNELNAVRNALAGSDTLRLQVTCNVLAQAQPLKSFVGNFIPSSFASGVAKSLSYSRGLVRPVAAATKWITGLAAVESGFLIQTGAAPQRFDEDDLAPLQVLIQYLTTMEGPLWKRVRGLGHAYSYHVRVRIEEGVLAFGLYKATNLYAAHHEAVAVVKEFADGTADFTQSAFEAAVSSAIFSVVSSEETVDDAAFQSLQHVLRQVSGDYNRKMLVKLQQVSIADLKRVLDRWLVPLFLQAERVAATLNAGKLTETLASFAGDGVAFEGVNIDTQLLL
eukprot:TRINITY_DN2477_c0_g1_i3.p1 TRINITY_DN2477_c0_g1~~TRINITY_DN2477_c0_g1_i3.p1  ORF type:complete len:857 (+),score=228.50 TRINITY_DN2477_c0_g1_i3:509-3079(+)